MANQTAIRAYAQAALETALEPWLKSLRQASARIEKSGQTPTLDDPTTPFAKKQSLLLAALPADTPAQVRNLIYAMASQNQISLLPEVLVALDQTLAGEMHREFATVTSAVELTSPERAQLEARLRKQYGDHLDLEYQVDPAILGGVILRVGDRVIDGSVASKLTALRQSIQAAR